MAGHPAAVIDNTSLIALPANEFFDGDGIDDSRSALGADPTMFRAALLKYFGGGPIR